MFFGYFLFPHLLLQLECNDPFYCGIFNFFPDAFILEKTVKAIANIVSSPYHMRRIKTIAGRVFSEDYKLYFIPTRYQNVNKAVWRFDKKDFLSLFLEYLKIVWFLLYSPFVDPDTSMSVLFGHRN